MFLLLVNAHLINTILVDSKMKTKTIVIILILVLAVLIISSCATTPNAQVERKVIQEEIDVVQEEKEDLNLEVFFQSIKINHDRRKFDLKKETW